MIEFDLRRELEAVARRFRRLWLWQRLALCWLVFTILGLVALPLIRNSDPTHAWITPVLVVSAVVAALACIWITRRSARDQTWLARRLEQQFPDLDSRLLTALEQWRTSPDGRLGFLQQTVVGEALAHAQKRDWQGVVPDGSLRRARFAHLTLLFALAIVAGLLIVETQARLRPLGPTDDAAEKKNESIAIHVDPGNTSIERGTSLLLLARFEGRLPTGVDLLARAEGKTPQLLAMSKSLDDPVFAGRIPSVEEDLTYCVRYDNAQTEWFRVTVFDFPDLVQADARLTFPSYTGMPSTVVEDTRSLSAVQGTKLTLVCRLNKPVATATLLPSDAKIVPGEAATAKGLSLAADASDPTAYSIELDLQDSLRLRLHLLDEEGRANKQPPEFVINVLPNRAPEVKVTAPARDVQASPLEELSLKARMWDDFGLRRYGVSYSLAGQPLTEVTLGETAPGKERRETQHVLALESLGAEPDQLLSYYFWAEDHAPDGGVRRTAGDMFFAEIRPFEEIFRQGEQLTDEQMQQQQQQQQQGSQNAQQAEQLAELQKQIINATWKLIRREVLTKPSAKFTADTKLIAESQASAKEQAAGLGEQLQDPRSKAYLDAALEQMDRALEDLAKAGETPAIDRLQPALAAEQSAYQGLLKLRAREHEVVRGNRQQRGGGGGGGGNRSQQQLNQLELSQSENRYESERSAASQQNTQQQAEERETRQVLNRLRELAQRQEDLNQQMKELQSALQEAKDEAQREELRRQLARLRDQQQQQLRDTDELRDRMDTAENQERMAEAREQLDETRSNIRRASESLEQGMVSQAAAAGARASEELNQLREQFRQSAAGQFTESMREMRDDARQLDQTQQDLSKRLSELGQSQQRSLRDSGERGQVAQGLQKQKQELEKLLENMRQTVETAETSEPLLSKQLYDQVRETRQQKTDAALDASRQLLEGGFLRESRAVEQEAQRGITNLREGVEQAAESVLGNEAEALRRARNELDQLAEELNREITRARGGSREQQEDSESESQPPASPSAADSNRQGDGGQEQNGAQEQSRQGERQAGDSEQGGSQRQRGSQAGGEQQGEGQKRDGKRGTGQQRDAQQSEQQQGGQQQGDSQQRGSKQGQSQQGQSQQGQGQQGQPQQGQSQNGKGTPRYPGQGGGSRENQGEQNGERQAGDSQEREGGQRDGNNRNGGDLRRFLDGGTGPGGNEELGPLAGEGFREWSDRLRDVEEMVSDPQLRAEAARIRDRARSMRAESKRHSKEPNWDLVQEFIGRPLVELRNAVNEELLRRESSDKLVPIDREPVPPEFVEQVRRYYERLGERPMIAAVDWTWGALDWLPAVAVGAGFMLLLLVWAYWRAPTGRGVRVLAAALKATGVAVLALCLLEPLLSGTRARPGANMFLVVADNSRSMTLKDRGESQSRGEQLQSLLADETTWNTRLAQDFEVRRYAFDSQIRSAADYSGLSLDGTVSALGAAIDRLARRYQGRPLAGILLFTDGNTTDAERLERILAERQGAKEALPPIYPVLIGGKEAADDVRLSRVSATQTSFEDVPVTLAAQVVTTGYRGANLLAQLLDEDGKQIDEQRVQMLEPDEPVAVRFQLKPESAGVSFYQVRASATGEQSQFDDPRRSREATIDNNTRLIAVDRGRGPYRVLYVAGRPNWEFKFLRRAVEEDDQVELVGLLRIAKREPKFDFRSRAGEGTNPLFRGFDPKDKESVEQYDEPVIVRLGTEDEGELRAGFPKTAEELYRYHAIVLDDVEADFFSPDQMLLVKEFVRQRGGGLLMLGGQESFKNGKFDRTPIGELLPVYLDQMDPPVADARFQLALTREGFLAPWVRLRKEEASERQRLSAMPRFQTVNQIRRVKPGATILATVSDDGSRQLPALVEQRFGQGRVGALLIGDLWRWTLRRPPDTEEDLAKSWRQTIRWLVGDVPNRVGVNVKQDEDAGENEGPVTLAVDVRDEKYMPLENASVTIRVTAPDKKQLELTAEPSDRRAGSYEAAYVARHSGAYRAQVIAKAEDGSEVGQTEAGWVSEPAADEFRELKPNRELLARLAEETGGELVAANDLDRFVATLPTRRVAISEPYVAPAWHQAWVFLLAIACLTAEWGIRRWNGLP